jgi:two-component system, cell cycle sensor histidine kinase and response regulator CckA
LHADYSQMHQVLLNLCINARDAMPHGGTITIKAETCTQQQVRERFPRADQEQYICISMADTGEGMDEATRNRIFDPFFTTKEQGKGTGLGLAVVYGVIQSHNGFIDVKSVPGQGTLFQIFLPVPVSYKPLNILPQETISYTSGGSEKILLVEDENLLLNMLCLALESNGYSVMRASDGNEAINVYQQHQHEIALVVTDMGLPGMAGGDEFKMLKEINQNVKVILASGFFDPKIRVELQEAGVRGFIQKPYRSEEVLRIIRKVLDDRSE